jgi:hypothetical protein
MSCDQQTAFFMSCDETPLPFPFILGKFGSNDFGKSVGILIKGGISFFFT